MPEYLRDVNESHWNGFDNFFIGQDEQDSQDFIW